MTMDTSTVPVRLREFAAEMLMLLQKQERRTIARVVNMTDEERALLVKDSGRVLLEQDNIELSIAAVCIAFDDVVREANG